MEDIELSKVSLKVGDTVRVKSSVAQPRYSWGGYVNHQSVGVVAVIEAGYLKVDFPDHAGWNADAGDLEVLPRAVKVSAQKQPRKSPEKVLAYAVMKDGDLHRIVYDRDVARSAKAKLGGKSAGATIVVLQAGKEIR